MKRTRIETRRGARRWLTLAALASGVLWSATLCAEPRADRAEARAHFDRGVAFGKQHAYRDALAEFQLAYAAFPNYGVLYNIAQAQILLERPSEALITLERYLAEGGAQIDDKRRSEVEALVLRQRQKTGTIAVSVEPSGAAVTLDDQPLGRAPLAAPLRVDPGVHRLKAVLDAGGARELTLEIAAGQTLEAHLDVAPPPTPMPSPPVASAPFTPATASRSPPVVSRASPTIAPADHSTRRALGYVIGAAGVVLSGVAIGHYLWNRGRYEDWQARTSDYERDPSDTNREAANRLARSIPPASAVTVGLTIGAGVALGTGGVLLITSSSSPSSSRSSGAHLSLRGEF